MRTRQMPIMDGITAAREIRTGPANPNTTTPIIALTANVSEEDRDGVKESGMNGMLSKPCTQERLQAVVRTWVLDNKA